MVATTSRGWRMPITKWFKEGCLQGLCHLFFHYFMQLVACVPGRTSFGPSKFPFCGPPAYEPTFSVQGVVYLWGYSPSPLCPSFPRWFFVGTDKKMLYGSQIDILQSGWVIKRQCPLPNVCVLQKPKQSPQFAPTVLDSKLHACFAAI